jgi:hypothetical protein
MLLESSHVQAFMFMYSPVPFICSLQQKIGSFSEAIRGANIPILCVFYHVSQLCHVRQGAATPLFLMHTYIRQGAGYDQVCRTLQRSVAAAVACY